MGERASLCVLMKSAFSFCNKNKDIVILVLSDLTRVDTINNENDDNKEWKR